MYRRLLFVCVAVLTLLVPSAAAANSIFAFSDRQPNLPEKSVVLTFDDGPSAYTAQILSILRREQVHATFFVVGNQVLHYPGMVHAAYEQGNEIGNHTFTHVNLQSVPDWRIKEELNLDELVIIHETGHETRLMRPPYLGSDNISASNLMFIRKLLGMGYIVAGEDIDTGDWKRPGAPAIVRSATAGGAYCTSTCDWFGSS